MPQELLCRRGFYTVGTFMPLGTFIPQGLYCRRGFYAVGTFMP